MRKIILRFRAVDCDNFEEIKRGLKTVETRAATIKYKNIKTGDVLDIRCGNKRLLKKVKKAVYFRSIESMLKKIPLRKIMPLVKTVEETRRVYFSYPGYEQKIKKFGIVAILI